MKQKKAQIEEKEKERLEEIEAFFRTLEEKTGFMTVLHELDHAKGLGLILHTPVVKLVSLNPLLIIFVQYLAQTSVLCSPTHFVGRNGNRLWL